eukprot:8396162-Pyramimonas_sp.AAC.1
MLDVIKGLRKGMCPLHGLLEFARRAAALTGVVVLQARCRLIPLLLRKNMCPQEYVSGDLEFCLRKIESTRLAVNAPRYRLWRARVSPGPTSSANAISALGKLLPRFMKL